MPLGDDLNKVKETWKQKHDINLKKTISGHGNFYRVLKWHRSSSDLELRKRIAALAPNDVKEPRLNIST